MDYTVQQTSHLAAALMASPSPMTKGPDFLNKKQNDVDSEILEKDLSQPKQEQNDESGAGSGEDMSDEESSQQEIGKDTPGRGVTLQMLLKDDILKPGKAAMTIEYLGQKFVGDLLADGKIKSHETETVFCSPSAWAIHCKRIINPDKRSGCGWASVKYRGKKLDTIKATYLRKKQLERENAVSDAEEEMDTDSPPEPPPQRTVYKHNTINSRMIPHDVNTLVEAVQFSTLGKVQPFLLTIGSNALLTLDLHCHLKTEEVCGYLGGSWDQNNHNLTITHTFPCLVSKKEKRPLVLIEAEIQDEMESLDLFPVGWYHSHPTNPAMPTLQDCDKQLDFQMKMRGPSDLTYTPCVGLICSPYNPDNKTAECSINCFYCLPPPEQRPAEYPRPLVMQFNVAYDTHLTNQVMNQIRKTIKYYLKFQDETCVKFQESINDEVTYLQKLNTSLKTKFPKGQSDGLMWHFIKDELGCSSDCDDKIDLDALLAVPQAIPMQKTHSPPTQLSSSAEHTPKKSKEAKDATSEMEALLDMTSRLTNPYGVKSDNSSSSSATFSSKLDMLTSMALGASSMSSSGLPLSSSLDSLSANKLLSDLTSGLPPNLAATLTGNKLLDPASYAQTLQSMASGKGDLTNPLASLASGLGSNLLMNPMELADALYSQRKYSSNSLLGIPDPLSKSTLAANNMFLSPALFNLSESLLKPPTSSKSHNSSKKNSSYYKGMKDYLPPEYNMGSYDRKYDGGEATASAPEYNRNNKKEKPTEDAHISDMTKNASYLSQMLDMSKASSHFPETADYSLEALKLMNSFNSSGQMGGQSSNVGQSNSEQDIPANFSKNADSGKSSREEEDMAAQNERQKNNE